MKIAKLFCGSPDNQKGAFNNIVERCRKLRALNSDVDLYMIRFFPSFFFRLLKRHGKRSSFQTETVVQGLIFRNIWIEMSLLDYLVSIKLGRRLSMGCSQLEQFTHLFSSYDLLSVHGYEAVFLAEKCKTKFNIPFVATWHGSDINYAPFVSKPRLELAKYFLERADHNFFVSERLMKRAHSISKNISGSVLYTGPSDAFLSGTKGKMDSTKRNLLPAEKPVVAFVGNLVRVKNVLVLPDIFQKVRENYERVSFVIVGDGDLRRNLEARLMRMGIQDVLMTGNVEPNEIPSIMGGIDILVLPSLNEGLPRVTLEAQCMGVAVVGSNRGGIPEAIGPENCFEIDDDFVSNISRRIIELLITGERPCGLPEKFSWDYALEHERHVHESILNSEIN